MIMAGLGEYREMARRALKRVTSKQLGYYLKREPESICNQFRDWNERKQPSAEAAYLLQRLNRDHMIEVGGHLGYVIGLKPRFTAPDTLMRIQERASKGYVSAAEVSELVSMTDMGER